MDCLFWSIFEWWHHKHHLLRGPLLLKLLMSGCRLLQKFPHKPALVVFDSYYFSTASLNRLNPSISSTDSHSPASVVRTKFIGAIYHSCNVSGTSISTLGDYPIITIIHKLTIGTTETNHTSHTLFIATITIRVYATYIRITVVSDIFQQHSGHLQNRTP